MISKAGYSFVFFVLGAVLGVFVSSTTRTDISRIPVRPPNVPDDAQWAGGADGGAWVQCEQIQNGALACRVYADVTGVLMEEAGEFAFDMAAVTPTFYSAGLIVASVRLERVVDRTVGGAGPLDAK